MHNTGLVQTLALNYGSRDEIIRALNRMLKDGISPTQENLDSYLDTASFPDVDMLIRTGGDSRLSNFLMWQAAYAELFFTPTLWPDFLVDELDAMLKDFYLRERRFGGIV
jgi:undecaprenyl diphosphate synthase